MSGCVLGSASLQPVGHYVTRALDPFTCRSPSRSRRLVRQ
jgi:hypothetical protein